MEKRVGILVVAVAILVTVCWRWGFSDNFDPTSLRDKVVLITGASTGIGEQLSYQYAKAGAALLLTARRENVLLQVATRCRQLGSPHVEVIAGDMGDASHRKVVVMRLQELFGRLDHLILNHVISNIGFWEGTETNVDQLRQIINVNLIAYVDMASRTLELLDKSGGSIGVLSSMAGNIGMPTLASYSTSKFALEGFFAALREELIARQKNVTVTVCRLGFIATDAALDFVHRKQGQDGNAITMAAQPNDTAAAIMKSVALKKQMLYYPPSTYWIILGHNLIPGLLEPFIRKEMCGS